jgi:outer membrane lipoprotein carrier protein
MCAVLGLIISGTANADAAEDLAERLEAVDVLQADFTQTVIGPRYEVMQNATGQLTVARPDRFKWVMQAPYSQLIVTAGDALYVYDPDLDQVNVMNLAEALDGTPALVLAGTLDDIRAHFEVFLLPDGELDQFLLTPLSSSSLYAELRMGFAGNRLVNMEIRDSLGQRTEVKLTSVTLNGPIDASEFEFQIPEGADVIGPG